MTGHMEPRCSPSLRWIPRPSRSAHRVLERTSPLQPSDSVFSDASCGLLATQPPATVSSLHQPLRGYALNSTIEARREGEHTPGGATTRCRVSGRVARVALRAVMRPVVLKWISAASGLCSRRTAPRPESRRLGRRRWTGSRSHPVHRGACLLPCSGIACHVYTYDRERTTAKWTAVLSRA